MRTFQVAVLAVCAAVAMGSLIFSRDLDQDWEIWKTQNNKMYTAEEEVKRRLIWEENIQVIKKHNLEYDMGLTTFTMGMNKYGDLTTTEFVQQMNGFLPGHPEAKNCPSTFNTPNFLEMPTSVDWRKKGYVTPVKDQMQCGSCWAFSTTGALEGQHFKKTGNLVSLSEQNLVDCSGDEGNLGCEGGWPVWADEYILKNGGIDTEASYPYVGMDEQCKFSKANVGATITGCTEVKAKSEQNLQEAIASIGPISVCIDAGHASFQMYSSGVYNEPDCSTTVLDHCVLAVGYDVTQDGTKYYIVKNSWGTDWGMQGYIWMSRDRENQCGIATNATYPLV